MAGLDPTGGMTPTADVTPSVSPAGTGEVALDPARAALDREEALANSILTAFATSQDDMMLDSQIGTLASGTSMAAQQVRSQLEMQKGNVLQQRAGQEGQAAAAAQNNVKQQQEKEQQGPSAYSAGRDDLMSRLEGRDTPQPEAGGPKTGLDAVFALQKDPPLANHSGLPPENPIESVKFAPDAMAAMEGIRTSLGATAAPADRGEGPAAQAVGAAQALQNAMGGPGGGP
jgi:hypothetical protein